MDLDKAFKSVYVKEDVVRVRKEFWTTRRKNTMFAGAAVIALSVVALFTNTSQKGNVVTRPDYGMGKSEIEVNAKVDGQETKLHLDVSEKEFTEEEIKKELENDWELLQKEVIGKNESARTIRSNLLLPTSVGEYGALVSWETGMENAVDYDGSIKWDEIDWHGKTQLPVTLGAKITFRDTVLDKSMRLILIKPQEDVFMAEMESYINGKDNIYSPTVTLPDEISGRRLAYANDHSMIPLIVLLGGIILCVSIYRSYGNKLYKKYEERNKQLLLDYPQIVSKLTLFLSAGLSILESMKKMVMEYDREKKKRYAYEELKLAISKISNGMNQKDAFVQFGTRCESNSYLKLGNLLAQNIKKGNSQMTHLLSIEVTNGYNERKAMVLKEAEIAGTKLVFPMMLMLLIVVIVVMVPAVLSMGFI